MRAWRTPAVGLLALFAALGAFAPAANGDETALERALKRVRHRLFVREFQVGHLEPGTDRFIPAGGDGAEDVLRDAVVMIVFSEPIALAREIRGNDQSPFVHIHDRSIRIGIPSENGLLFHEPGAFYRYVVKEFDPQQGYVPARVYSDRVLFDPTRRFDVPFLHQPEGFEADTLYSVTVPAPAPGARKTVRTRDGASMGRTFTATFRTGARYLEDHDQPTVVQVRATDDLSTPLAGRAGVDPAAVIIVNFSESMLPQSIVVGASFRVRDAATGADFPGAVGASLDLRVFSFRPAPDLGEGPREIEVILSGDIRDLAGNFLHEPVSLRFETREN